MSSRCRGSSVFRGFGRVWLEVKQNLIQEVIQKATEKTRVLFSRHFLWPLTGSGTMLAKVNKFVFR